MLVESRRILALMGDQKVTICAFIGLLLYGSIQLMRSRPRSGRLRAVIVSSCAALWLLIVRLGAIYGDLAQWSSAAVFLFAIGIEGGSIRRPEQVGDQGRRLLSRRFWIRTKSLPSAQMSAAADAPNATYAQADTVIGPTLSN